MKRCVITRFVPVVALISFYLVLSALLRVVLFARFGSAADVPWLALGPVLAAGAINDAVQSLYLFLPFVLVSLLPDPWYRRRGTRVLAIAASTLVVATLVFLAAVEFYFFEEFDARFNIVAFDYLMYPTEVLGDIRSEYPLAPVLAAAAVAAILVVTALRSLLLKGFDVRVRVRERFAALGSYGFGKLNVVLVSSESFGAEFSALYGSDRDLTPNFDAFAREGLWFSNAEKSPYRRRRLNHNVRSGARSRPTIRLRRP
ncbi:MAG: hypothetical protein ACRETT_13895 [Steroidobacteraceae bacterium]